MREKKKFNLLSIIVPCFNEVNNLEKVVEEIKKANTGGLKKEVIIIDDGSTDGSTEIIKKIKSDQKIQVKTIFFPKNQGKGAAVKAGILASLGDIVIIQDADLEYTPDDYYKILTPFLFAAADVVYGSRFTHAAPRRVIPFRFWLANRFLTGLSNLFTNLSLTDMETGCKVFRGSLIREIAKGLKSHRFGFEPEITAKIARIKGVKVYEVGIAYWEGRTYEEGKKMLFVDGIKALLQIIYFNLFSSTD